MIKSKWILAAGAAAVAVLAVGAPVASSWATALPEGATGVYCYQHAEGEENPERVHLTTFDGPSADNVMLADRTPQTWDAGQNTYVAGDTENVRATVDPKWTTEMTYLCQVFAGADYRYAIAS
jgi:hypothetical protein